MNNDLISREALKKEFLKYKPYAVDFLSLIDNAPTVPLPDFKEGYKQAIIDGKTNFSDRYDEGYAQGYIDGSTGADWKGGAE